MKTSSPDSVVRQWSIIADIVKLSQTDKVQLIKTLNLHPGLGYTIYRWDCKPNSLHLLHSGTRHWVKQGWQSKGSQSPKYFGMCCPIKHTARNLGSSSRYSAPKLTFYYLVPFSATCNKFNTSRLVKGEVILKDLTKPELLFLPLAWGKRKTKRFIWGVFLLELNCLSVEPEKLLII